MPRPTTKEALLKDSEHYFTELQNVITSLSQEKQEETFPFEDRDRNLRDVLIHLYEWHQLLLIFVNTNQNGEKTSFLPAPYNWRTYQGLNIEFCKKHQSTTLVQAKQLLIQSHNDIMALLKSFTNEQLFTKKYYPWTGTASLGSYATSATSSHYNWAIKKIKKFIKESK